MSRKLTKKIVAKRIKAVDVPLSSKFDIFKITDELAANAKWKARFGRRVICPECTTFDDIYIVSSRNIFKCGACGVQFSGTSRTLLSHQKLDDRRLYAALYLFCAAKKGISSPEMARVVGMQQSAAYKLLRKFRDAIQALYADVTLSGTVEVDGAFFGGHIQHQNKVEEGRSRRVGRWHYGNRRVVVVLRQRLGKTLTFVGKRESDAKPFIMERVAEGSIIVVDQAHAWDGLMDLYDGLRINHRYAFYSNQTHTNNAESYFATLRRCQNGTYHKISGAYLHLYAQEIAWRLDNKDTPTTEMVGDLLGALLTPIALPEWFAQEMAA